MTNEAKLICKIEQNPYRFFFIITIELINYISQSYKLKALYNLFLSVKYQIIRFVNTVTELTVFHQSLLPACSFTIHIISFVDLRTTCSQGVR